MMDLKDYREMPDEGVYEKIARRVRLRRVARIGGVVSVVAVVAMTAGILLPYLTTSAKEPARVAVAEVPVVSNPEEIVAQPEEQLVGVAVRQDDEREDVAQATLAVAVPSEPAASSLQPARVQEQPVLPPAAVVPETTPVADLIFELANDESDNTSEVMTPSSKDGGAIPVAPHYENVLWAPNVIVPTDDNPDNRVFKVQCSSTISNFRMMIYNRSGRQVFYTNDINQGWDATRNGSLVPQGAYVWVASFRDSDGNIRQEKGSVTVVR